MVHYHTTLGESYFFNRISASFASGSVIFPRILDSEGTAPAKAAPSGRVPLTQKADRSGINIILGGSLREKRFLSRSLSSLQSLVVRGASVNIILFGVIFLGVTENQT